LLDVDDFISPDGERIIDEEGDLDNYILNVYDKYIPDNNNVAKDSNIRPPVVTIPAVIEVY
jgi:hypothetical protein